MPKSTLVIVKSAAMRRARIVKGLSQRELAQRAGCLPALVSLAEVGRPIGIERARRIARALRVPLREVLAESMTGRVGGGASGTLR
jgi:transcriptional regulator with XRE-family HTH domain